MADNTATSGNDATNNADRPVAETLPGATQQAPNASPNDSSDDDEGAPGNQPGIDDLAPPPPPDPNDPDRQVHTETGDNPLADRAGASNISSDPTVEGAPLGQGH